MARKRKDEGYPQQKCCRRRAMSRRSERQPRAPLERKRVYRTTESGKVAVEEAAKLSYMLTGIRTDLEADTP